MVLNSLSVPSHSETCSICGLNVHTQCPTCVLKLCLKCDLLFHSHPDRKGHKRSVIAAAKASR